MLCPLFPTIVVATALFSHTARIESIRDGALQMLPVSVGRLGTHSFISTGILVGTETVFQANTALEIIAELYVYTICSLEPGRRGVG